MISLFSLFEIISAYTSDPKTFFLIAACVADAAAVNLNGMITILVNALSTFFINSKPVFRNGPKNVPKNPPDCLI